MMLHESKRNAVREGRNKNPCGAGYIEADFY